MWLDVCGVVMEMGIRGCFAAVVVVVVVVGREGARRLRIFITAIIESVFSLTSSAERHISARRERHADDLVTCD